MENKEANPKCPTCGGSKKICPNCGGSQNTCGCDEQTITTTKTRWIPCPDCEEMPESQEPETQEGYGYCSKCQSFTPHHKGQCCGDKCKESQGSGMTVFIATSWGAHNTDIHGVFTEEKLGEAFLAQAGLEDIIGCGVTEWEVQTSQEPIPQGWEKEMGENLEKYGKVYNPNESDEPEGQESGLAESDYMSIEQREKFEAGHVPEKVEASELAKRARRAIADIVVAAPDDEQAVKEAMKILYKACDRLEAAEEENITTKEIARAEVKDLQEEIKQLKAKLEAAEKKYDRLDLFNCNVVQRYEKVQAKLEAVKLKYENANPSNVYIRDGDKTVSIEELTNRWAKMREQLEARLKALKE